MTNHNEKQKKGKKSKKKKNWSQSTFTVKTLPFDKSVFFYQAFSSSSIVILFYPFGFAAAISQTYKQVYVIQNTFSADFDQQIFFF